MKKYLFSPISLRCLTFLRIPIPGVGNSDAAKINVESGFMGKGDYIRSKGFSSADYKILDNQTADREIPVDTRKKLWIQG